MNMRCPVCNREDSITLDPRTGRLVCTNCGYVFDELNIDQGTEWRAYTQQDRLERERVGSPMRPKVHEKKLTPAECAVVISIDILSKAGIPTTPKKIADFLKEDVQTVRNILERLRKKGLVISSLAFGLGGFARKSSSSQVSGRERIHRLVDDIENILQQHPEILDWAKVSLGINDKNELIEYINKLAEKERLESTDWDIELFGAAMTGDLIDVQTALENGANPNFKNNIGWTPIHLAAVKGHVEIVRVLLERGADPNAKENIYGWTPLHIAANIGYFRIVKLLLERGADPNAKDNDGRTPLHIAAREGRVEIVKILLERGADPRIADNEGHTPLDYAKDSTIRSLLESAFRNS